MLLVDDRERQIPEDDALLKQRVGADHDRDRAVGEPVEDRLPCLALVASG